MTDAWLVPPGRFFFKFRNALLPILFVLLLVAMRPAVIGGSRTLDRALGLAGILVAVAGEAVRLTTIGFDYIDRGGKNKQVSASRLVRGGIYALTRNPMYVGNLLIATGLTMVMGAPWAYAIVIPFFLFVYRAIIATEEQFLHQQFGAEYEVYCRQVPRFWPTPRGLSTAFAGMAYQGRRALRQDLSTITWISLVLAGLPLWRAYFLDGASAAKFQAPRTGIFMGIVLLVFWGLVELKRRKKFFY